MSKKKYLFVDADTICVAQAATCQLNLAVHCSGEYICNVSSQKSFFEAYPDADKETITFVNSPILTDTIKAHLDKYNNKPPMGYVKKRMQEIEAKFHDREVWWCVQGKDNYRMNLYPNYKGERVKILLRQAVTDRLVELTSNHIISEGEETDDVVAKYCYAGYKQEVATGFNPYMIAHVDKDLDTVAGDHYCYGRNIVYKVTEKEAWFNFCVQLLTGDTTDNIKGLNGGMPPEYFIEKGIRKAKGLGKVTATNILKQCKTMADMTHEVARCYQHVHGDNWIAAMQEETLALRMRHKEGEMLQIKDILKEHSVL